jgi:hypothetical protein
MRNFKKLPQAQNPTELPPGTGISGNIPAQRIQILDGGVNLSELHPVMSAGPNHAAILGTLPGDFGTIVRAGRP